MGRDSLDCGEELVYVGDPEILGAAAERDAGQRPGVACSERTPGCGGASDGRRFSLRCCSILTMVETGSL